ncbi:MAG TPA: undecaprenyldiphospho-muramoylpentapeptide beta-N-acetylglucosaminyltransferase [Polyangia bacterium]|nr:undecaprenyldiphospho-muramoylpentapeptide beta-N-acetylglucosaminyltransferase [Polyangia bacterium]
MTAEASSPLRVLIAGGGTGGHLYPGIALAEEITATPGGEVLFVGTSRGLESKLVPAAGFALELMDIAGLKRKGLGGLVRGLALLPRAFARSREILRQFRPDLVVGVGGYASGPLCFVAALTGYPTVIQEQNSRPGFTNRVLGRLARRVFIAFNDARRSFAARKLRLVGNPVRKRFLDRVAARAAEAPGQTLLVLGGSQGSHAINELAAAMLQVLKARDVLPPKVVHQTGSSEVDRMDLYYEALGYAGRVEVRAFIDDMPAALADAALVVARAGALTLAELAIMGRPAVLIPLPTAADDHQTRNALEFARAGAAVLFPQYDTVPSQLADIVQTLLADPAQRARMATAMQGLARPNATREIVAELRAIVDRRRPRAEKRASA